MADAAQPSRALSADEVSALGPPPDADAETPTTNLFDSNAQATAEVHFPGVAESAQYAAQRDTLPDPASAKEN
jgi:hypothetical protein